MPPQQSTLVAPQGYLPLLQRQAGYFAEDEADLATAADKGKHRQGYKPVKVAVSVGNGRIRNVLFYKGELRKGAYVDIYVGSNFD